MAKSSTRRVTIYINGSHAKKIKELRQYHYKKMYFCKVIAISEIV